MKGPHKARARETSEAVKVYNERAETTQPGSPAAVLANLAVGQSSIGWFQRGRLRGGRSPGWSWADSELLSSKNTFGRAPPRRSAGQ